MKDIAWSELSFGYMPTDYNVRCCYRNGKWGEIEVCSDEYLKIHMAATCLHYGQEAFEGLKAYRCPDGKVRLFRVEENAARLQSTCRGIMMPELPTELFVEMAKKVVRLNQEYIPTYESGATLYLRPLLIGTSAQVGVHPAEEYMFLIFATPVGPYFKGGFSTNPYVIIRDFDRSAPLGTGIYKVGGNYAASLRANHLAHEKGYACEFYLDAKEKKYMDECGAANFFGIKNNTYVTPKSTSILPSITNKSLMQLAEDFGMTVERRQIPEEETCHIRRGRCLRNSSRYQPDLIHRRPRHRPALHIQQGWQARSCLYQALQPPAWHTVRHRGGQARLDNCGNRITKPHRSNKAKAV